MLYILQVFLFLILIIPTKCYSAGFEDNFNLRDDSSWKYIEKNGKIEYHDGQIELSSQTSNFPELYSRKQIFSKVGDELEITFKFNDNGDNGDYPPSGTGIGVGNTYVSGNYTFYQFTIWRDKANGPKLFINDFGLSKNGFCDFSTPGDEMQYLKTFGLNLNRYDWNTLRIILLENNSYSISVNDVFQRTTADNQCTPSLITVGNPLSGANYWNGISIDKIKFNSVAETSSKTIVIPGMGASWNERAMVFNEVVADDQWKMTPFVHNYDELIESFGDDVLVWNYDWRKPVKDMAVDLDEFIDKNFEADEKFSIVGHSLGGLVARIWLNDNLGDTRVEKITTLGSPHRGSIDAYRIWAGGNISENVDVSSIALNVLLQLQKKNGENKVDTIRRYAPALKDVSPTFDFIKKNGKIITNTASAVGNTDGRLFTISGTGHDTERWVKLGARNRFEEVLGWWPDGKILGYEYADGDKTVLATSSNYGNNSLLDSDHGDLPNNWVFYIGSPAKLKIECANKPDIESNDFIVIKKELVDGCKLKIVGTGNDIYHFVYGINGVEDSWGYKESEIKTGEEVVGKIDSEGGKIVFDNSLMKMLLELKSNNKNSKEVDKAISLAKNNNWKGCLNEIFVFRLKNSERKLTNQIIDELIILMDFGKGSKIGAEWWNQSNKMLAKTIDMFSKKVTKNMALSYLLWADYQKELENCYQNKKYSCVETRGLVNSYLLNEIIFSK